MTKGENLASGRRKSPGVVFHRETHVSRSLCHFFSLGSSPRW
jgi:hypothetical protein